MVSLLAALSLAADLSGIWVGFIERPNAEPIDIAFQLTQRGAVLTGKLYDDYKSPPITEGKVTGDLVNFAVLVSEQAGNEIRQTRYRFTGKLVNGLLEMTREREASINAANGGGVQPSKNTTKQTFQLKRLVAHERHVRVR